MASPLGVVVWEYMDLGGSWYAFQPNVSDSIDIQYLSWGNGRGGGAPPIVLLGTFDGVFNDAVLDLQQNIQINAPGSARAKIFGANQSVRRSIYRMNSPPAIGIEWQWSTDTPGQWIPYTMPVQCFIEEAKNYGMQQVDLKSSPDPLAYVIDFASQCQINDTTRFTRQIQRVQTAWKYTQTAPLPPPTSTNGSSQMASIGLPKMANQFNVFNPGPFQYRFPQSSISHSGMVGSALTQSLFPSGQFLRPGFQLPLSSSGLNYPSIHLNPAVLPPHIASILSNGFPHSINGGLSSSNPYSLRSSSRQQQQQQPSAAASSAGGIFVPGAYSGSLLTVNMPSGSSTKTSISPTKAGARSKNSGSNRKRMRTEPTTISNQDSPYCGVSTINSYVTALDEPPAGEDCCICCDSLSESSGYDAGSSESKTVQLVKCKHIFHRACLAAMVANGTLDGSLQCPTCKRIYGVKCGNCPTGLMQYASEHSSLPGFPKCGTIRVMYIISPGTQGPSHPHPGQPYNARGFPRQGILPDNEEGKKVLKLLITAFRRRLTFTVGQSVTTGEADTVVWNEIHHKTETTNANGHGYPDPNYLTNVVAELAAQGVVEEEEEEDSE